MKVYVVYYYRFTGGVGIDGVYEDKEEAEKRQNDENARAKSEQEDIFYFMHKMKLIKRKKRVSKPNVQNYNIVLAGSDGKLQTEPPNGDPLWSPYKITCHEGETK
jgi:hypothetical protein